MITCENVTPTNRHKTNLEVVAVVVLVAVLRVVLVDLLLSPQ